MKIATWNINSIRVRQQRLAAWLDAHCPDVLGLQEIKVVDEDFPGEVLRTCGYHAAVHGQKTYNGVALLSRRPITDPLIGFGDDEPDDQARIIAGTFDDTRVITVYVPNGQAPGTDKYAYKLRWLARLRSYLERTCRPDQPVVLCGDFNVAPDDRDVYDPAAWEGKIMCSEAERQALADVVDWGLHDVFRKHHSEGGLYTWWDYRRLAFPKGRGLRIDHIFVTEPLLARSTGASIDREARKGKQPSDHAPVIASFE